VLDDNVRNEWIPPVETDRKRATQAQRSGAAGFPVLFAGCFDDSPVGEGGTFTLWR